MLPKSVFTLRLSEDFNKDVICVSIIKNKFMVVRYVRVTKRTSAINRHEHIVDVARKITIYSLELVEQILSGRVGWYVDKG